MRDFGAGRRLLPLLIMFAVPAAAEVPAQSAPDTVTRLADEYVAAYIERSPEAAFFSGTQPPAFDHLTDYSPAAIRAWEESEDAWWGALSSVDSAALVGTPEWVTYGFLREALESARGLRACRQELWPVTQMFGWPVLLATLAGMLPVDSPAQRNQVLALWATVPAYLATEIANAERGLEASYSTPRPNVERVMAQIDGLIDVPFAESPFASPGLRANDEAFKNAWEQLLADDVLPAMRRYRTWLEESYLPKARTESGVSALPNGKACYAASLRAYTGLAVSPETMYENGRRAVEERQAVARRLAAKVYGTTDLSTLRGRFEADASNHFKTREEVLAFSQAAVDRAWRALPRAFGRLPESKVEIQPIPAFDEEHGVPHYIPGTRDGSRPGVYAISLFEPQKQSRSKLEAVAFHETVPGHHMQIAIGLERPAAHPITGLVWNSGFTEGWAVYAEELADEMGLFSSDLTRLGEYVQLPTGMVADPGLHVLGWSRQDVIDYFLETRPDYSPELAESQADRIAMTPGQLTTYFAGAIEIRALRDLAEARLGPDFDLREFHDRVLEDGSITLPMLKDKIQRWLDTREDPRARD